MSSSNRPAMKTWMVVAAKGLATALASWPLAPAWTVRRPPAISDRGMNRLSMTRIPVEGSGGFGVELRNGDAALDRRAFGDEGVPAFEIGRRHQIAAEEIGRAH